MRVAVWTPMPPVPSGIADYNYALLGEMARDPDKRFTVIVRDDDHEVRCPRGVAIRHVGDYVADDFDLDVYHMGNNPDFHGYMLRPISDRPGLLVLHDPAIADCLEVLMGGRHRRIFEVEVAHNLGCSERDAEQVHGAIARWDRTELLMSRRLVEKSRLTLVHSDWAAHHLRERFDTDRVRAIPFAVTMGPLAPPRSTSSTLSLGVFGNISFHKRVPQVVAAFAEVRRRGRDATLVVAGRHDSRAAEEHIRRLIAENGLDDVVQFLVDVDAEDFSTLQAKCDLVVGLRWPTAGETSASLLECFALGKAAIVSDVAQNREFDDDFCRRITTTPDAEHEQLVEALCEAADDVEAVRDAGERARHFAREHHLVEDVARAHLAAIDDAWGVSLDPSPSWASLTPRLAVNAIGSWAGATGLAEAGRRAVVALLNEGLSVAIEDVNLWAKLDPGRVPDEIKSLPLGHPYPLDVAFLNVNEFHVVSDEQLRGVDGQYLIAMWYWELPALPTEMIREIARVDEIWVASAFVKDVFTRYTDKPIHVMPCVVEPSADLSLSRADLGLPGDDVVIFLVTFDANSTIARKNPYGALKAFEEAFGCQRRDVVLVVKVVNLHLYPVVQHDLRVHLERLGGILIESDMTGGEIAALIKACDVYVSMHRSEGFGLGLAEAMFYGRPVIATANSGNMDFMNAANSCLVSYASMVVGRDELMDNPTAMVLYQPGNLWVDPDVSDAARLMRWLFENPALRARLGARAASDIRRNYSLAAAGRAMRRRLEEVTEMIRDGWRREDDILV